MRHTVYDCLECGHRSQAPNVRDAAIDARDHQLEQHGRLGWRHYVTGTMSIDPLPVQPKLW